MPARQASGKGWYLVDSNSPRMLTTGAWPWIQLQLFLYQLQGTESSTYKPFIYRRLRNICCFKTLTHPSSECTIAYLRGSSFKWLISCLAKHLFLVVPRIHFYLSHEGFLSIEFTHVLKSLKEKNQLKELSRNFPDHTSILNEYSNCLFPKKKGQSNS